MISDAERREVARRLLELHLDPWDDAACEIAQCAGIACCNSECHGSNETPECMMMLASQLADLIEPAPERTYHPERIGTAYHSALMCSACKYPIDDVTIYCPHCGARLEGVGR